MSYKENVILSQKGLRIISLDKTTLVSKAKRGPSKQTRIPLGLNEKLAFLSGVIIGDGHLRKNKFQINFECVNPLLTTIIRDFSKEIFEREFNIKKRMARFNQQKTTILYIDGKAIYMLLNRVFEIPIGKKSSIVKVPKVISNSKNPIKAAFMIGIMATEGGKRKRGYGLSTASYKLREEIVSLLSTLSIRTYSDEWMNRKYNKRYYGIVYKKEELSKLTSFCKDKDVGSVLSICPNFQAQKL